MVVDFGDLITKIYQSHGGCPLDSRLQTFDINNDDIDDLAVSTAGDDAGGSRRGVVHSAGQKDPLNSIKNHASLLVNVNGSL